MTRWRRFKAWLKEQNRKSNERYIRNQCRLVFDDMADKVLDILDTKVYTMMIASLNKALEENRLAQGWRKGDTIKWSYTLETRFGTIDATGEAK